MSLINYNFDKIKDPFVYRLASEHQRLDRLAKVNRRLMTYEATEFSKVYPHPPIAYKINYLVKSITGLSKAAMPIYGSNHEMVVKLPHDFPEQPADCKMVSDTWHPNIKSSGPFKGSICTNHAGFGSLFFLDELIIRIGEFLQYQRYMAEDRAPWPEDMKVARWVREVGEPKKLVGKQDGLYTDNQQWKKWDEKIEEEELEIFFAEKEVSENANKSSLASATKLTEENQEEDNEISFQEIGIG